MATLAAMSVPRRSNDEDGRTERWLEIWRETVPVHGTTADAYLQGRGVPYSGAALRWHPSCPFGKGMHYGCIVALVRDIVRNELVGIHRTALDPGGIKIGRRALGPTAGGAIKLTDDEDVTLSLAIGEGIESTLSIRQLPDLSTMPVWSILNSGGIATFPVLPGVETLWIGVDHDRAGILTARKCAERWLAAGREVMMLAPQLDGTDLNDVVGCHG